MTKREELIAGLRAVERLGLRATSTFAPGDWSIQVHGEDAGWDRKNIFCHLAAVAEITPGFVSGLASQSDGQNATDGLDIDAFNAQLVAAKAQLSPQELMVSFQSAYEGVVKFVQEAPEETLQRQARFGKLEAPVVDIMEYVLVLHGMAHIYSAVGPPL